MCMCLHVRFYMFLYDFSDLELHVRHRSRCAPISESTRSVFSITQTDGKPVMSFNSPFVDLSSGVTSPPPVRSGPLISPSYLLCVCSNPAFLSLQSICLIALVRICIFSLMMQRLYEVCIQVAYGYGPIAAVPLQKSI